LEKAPNDPIALIRLGALYDQTRNLPQAKAAFEKALTVNPNLVPALTRLAEICSRTPSDHARALELVKQARPLVSNDPVSSHLLGRAAYRAGDPESGLILLQTAAARDRDNPACQYDLAMCYYHLGKLADANETMQRVASASPSGPEGASAKEYLQLAATMANPDQLKAAEPRLIEILRAQPDYLPALYAQALIYELRGDLKGAARQYDDILKNHASFTPAMRNLAILEADHLGNDDKAYPLATRAQSASPKDPKLNSVLGKILYRRGSFSQAVGLLKPSVLQLPNDADALFCLGVSQFKLDQKKEARATLQQALNAGLSGKSADEAKRILLETK
jgi:tetratricopeptide (TPR) repeat protein